MKKTAIITTHPIQYNAPLFKMLHERKQVDIKVFYTWSQSAAGEKYDPGFGKTVNWDIPLLEGYPYRFINNISNSPGSSHFTGIDNPTLIREIKDWGADIVLVYGWNFRSHLKIMRYFHGKIPILFRGDSTLINNEPGIKTFLRHLFLRRVYSFVDKALYAGTANKKYFLKNSLKEEQLYFVPHTVDNKRFSENTPGIETQVKKIKDDLKIPGDVPVFLFAGKLEENKNPVLLLKAFIALNDYRSHLIFAGTGPLEKALRIQAQEKNNIHFIGFQNQSMMPAVYRTAGVYILPSRSETWGLGVNEAMAAGLAIICSDRCGCAEDLVKQNENGFVFKHDDAEDLKIVLKKITERQVDIAEFGKSSANIIEGRTFLHACKAIEDAVNS